MHTSYTTGVLALALSSTLLLTACGDSSTRSPTAPVAAPSVPVIGPPANLQGTWVGQYVSEPMECLSSSGPGSATFTQDGASVVARLTGLSEWCGFKDIRLDGSLNGNVVSGILPEYFPGANAIGELKGEVLQLTLYNQYGYGQGTLTLHR